MPWFWIRLGARMALLVLGFAVGLPALMMVGLVALPGMLLSAVPGRLGFGTIDLGRFGTLSFGASEAEKAKLRAVLALIKRDFRRLRHPIRWPS